MIWGVYCMVCTTAFADHPIAFPWGTATPRTTPKPPASAPYQILQAGGGHEQPSVTIQQLRPKVGYAYGWFGSNSTPHLTRHLGFNQNYTQWKLTP